ncbi:hypothetical protein QZM22_16415 [Burkholderia oklahomensis]|uniref:hypothetical protein n=1 Tax=Burkholderia oklahomensis TaxID=342113 RepID=UPI00264AF6EA|nr:hypothetical protein [Burkholderia oklahomensis]MDN7674066.1 hypothetical protein [Burkholderia oklahomensis]
MTVNNCNTLIPGDILNDGETVDKGDSGVIARRRIAALFGLQMTIPVNMTGLIVVESANQGILNSDNGIFMLPKCMRIESNRIESKQSAGAKSSRRTRIPSGGARRAAIGDRRSARCR